MVEDPHLLVSWICSISISSKSVVPTVIARHHGVNQSVDDIGRDGGNSLRRHSVKSKSNEDQRPMRGLSWETNNLLIQIRRAPILLFSLDAPILISNPQP